MLIVPFNPDLSSPLYEQIYEQIKKDIRAGILSPDTKLPSSRTFAEQLNVSRSTVNSAYEQLLSEGYIYAREKSGYYVSDINTFRELQNAKEAPLFLAAAKEVLQEHPKRQFTFSPFAIDTENFPFNIWRRLTNTAINSLNAHTLALGSSQGDYSFRLAICSYLSKSRGVVCSPEQVLVGAGTDYLLMLL